MGLCFINLASSGGSALGLEQLKIVVRSHVISDLMISVKLIDLRPRLGLDCKWISCSGYPPTRCFNLWSRPKSVGLRQGGPAARNLFRCGSSRERGTKLLEYIKSRSKLLRHRLLFLVFFHKPRHQSWPCRQFHRLLPPQEGDEYERGHDFHHLSDSVILFIGIYARGHAARNFIIKNLSTRPRDLNDNIAFRQNPRLFAGFITTKHRTNFIYAVHSRRLKHRLLRRNSNNVTAFYG